MTPYSRSFLGDNTGPGAQAALDAIARENANEAVPYGDDATTHQLRERCREFFATDLEIYPVASGTGANAVSLSTLCPADGAILCNQHAHIAQSESGAVEMFTGGARLVLLEGADAKLTAAALESELAKLRGKGDAAPAAAAVSVSQATELGTLYEPAELSALSNVCARHKLALHMDGARLFHALASSGQSPADLTWRSGVDVLSFGMTKCGALFGEVVVVFTNRLAVPPGNFRRRRRRGGHTLSKMRFVSAQLLALLEQDLWKTEAHHANRMAQQLGDVLTAAGARIYHPVQSNQVFAELQDATVTKLRAAGWSFRDWFAAGPRARRFVTSAVTTPAALHALASDLATF